MNAEIVAIGSELLLGQIVDSNSAWISKDLLKMVLIYFTKRSLEIIQKEWIIYYPSHYLGQI